MIQYFYMTNATKLCYKRTEGDAVPQYRYDALVKVLGISITLKDNSCFIQKA